MYLPLAEYSEMAAADPTQNVTLDITFKVKRKHLDEAAYVVGSYATRRGVNLVMDKEYGMRTTVFNVRMDGPAWAIRDYLLATHPLLKR